MKTLKLIAISDLRTAKDGRDYFVASFRAGFGQRPVKRTFWQQFERDAKTQEKTEHKYWERASYTDAVALLKSGEAIEGEKVTAVVETYILGENEVSTFSTVIFPDEKAENVFAAQNHPMVDEQTGELLSPKKVKAVISTAKAAEMVANNAAEEEQIPASEEGSKEEEF